MTGSPRVSCILAVWNGAAYLADALRSILSQTFRDFELITVDDGSTDGTLSILERFQREDGRIRLFRQAHSGLVAALNRGVALALGEYFARMGADDISMPERFEVQVNYLDRHHDVGICGVWVETFGDGRGEIIRYPCDDGTIRSRLLFESALAHPSVMLRRNVLERHGLGYDVTALHAEDYDLWVRAARHTRFANIPSVLLHYRIHPQQVGRRHEEAADGSVRRIRSAQLNDMGIQPTEQESNLHQDLSGWRVKSTPEFLQATREWLCKLKGANAVVHRYPQAEFRVALSQRWAKVCAAATFGGIRTLAEFWRAPRLAFPGMTPFQHFKFAVKCLIRKDPQTPFVKVGRVAN
ncbi:MAG: glycosyltransferase [Nitrospira sp.]|nr:glycosyltransferase [Nitrospira sp.]